MSVEEHFRSVIEGAVERAVEGHSPEAIDRLVSSGGLGEVINETIPEVSAILASSLAEAMPKMVAERRGVEATMAEEVRRAYGGGFDLCEAILRIASECGGEYVDQHFDLKEGVPVLWWVLGHLQARACRIAEEALVLLKAGYGLGAYSRWRSLHEVVVVGAFIQQHGEETALRYVDHLGVHRWRLLQAASESGRLEDEHRTELDNAQSHVDELEAKYDKRFLLDYGWAADVLHASPHRGFRAIEVASDFAHLRVDYRHASAAVHASAGMVLEPPDADYGGSTMQTGPSLVAIATPAHAIALSLVVSTGTLLTSTDSWAAPYVLSAMLDLHERAGKALVDAEAVVERHTDSDDGNSRPEKLNDDRDGA